MNSAVSGLISSYIEKYEIGHCESSLIFIPYGCMVDEFQHKVYENPEMTPEQRNELWLSLEKKYRPWIDFDNLPFYSRGGGWQRQLHIVHAVLQLHLDLAYHGFQLGQRYGAFFAGF